ncbi:hypothetical protein A8M77_12540 [Variovorax sp. JS1663]|nr:hypothetical protein A8M77_12540 [Variovorax sp. JS1663]
MDPGKDATTLIVLFHGFDREQEDLLPLRKLLREQFPAADILPLDLPFALLSTARPADVVARALARIDQAWSDRKASGGPYQHILLVGHSMGALYARKVYAAANGSKPGAPFEPDLAETLAALGAPGIDKERDWARQVDRLVLLAGMNRGWTISHHMSLQRALYMSAGSALGDAMGAFGKPPIVFSARRGAPFITQLRLQWLEMRTGLPHDQPPGRRATRCRTGPPVPGGACVVQLLGTKDDLVPPDDNIDLITGDDFVYLDVPRSGHADVVEVADPEHGAGRARVLLDALTKSEFGDAAVQPVGKAPVTDPTVKDVVFVMHGIRDEGYWTEKIARRIVHMGRERKLPLIATETSSYGYFPMFSFLRPGARQEKVEWLMDRYTEAKAQYPAAAFSYVGHSHGTYLIAKALEDYPAVRFKNVAFAGSVVHRDYGWPELIRQGRVSRVLNFLASADWVVAWFPNALQEVGIQDLGSAGHDGFRLNPEVNTRRAAGGHSAALDEGWWDTIAGFVLTGQYQEPHGVRIVDKADGWVRYPAYAAWAIWILIAVVLLWILRRLLRWRVREWVKTLAVVGYAALVWTVLTRF